MSFFKHLTKSITWRIISTIITILIIFSLTGELELSLTIGAIEIVIKIILYIIHDYMWELNRNP